MNTTPHPSGQMTVISLLLTLFFSCSSPTSAPTIPTSAILPAEYARPLTDITYESTPERIARGKYLTDGMWCTTCHTERDTTKAGWPPIKEGLFAGALRWKTDSTHLYAPNLTPDKETGIGNYTDDMLARAIREGVGNDGRSLINIQFGGMPKSNLNRLNDEDLASIIVYLRSLPAIKNKIPSRNVGDQIEKLGTNSGNLPLPRKVPFDENNVIEKGKYLIEITHCEGCHSDITTRSFGGGRYFKNIKDKILVSPNISSDISGIGGWDAETFISVIRNGRGKSGQLHRVMPWVSFRNFTDEDLSAIFYALKSTYPVKHIVINSAPPTFCPVCEHEHGAGSTNQKEVLKPFAEDFDVPSDLPGKYYGMRYDRDSISLFMKDQKLLFTFRHDPKEWELVPINDSTFVAEGFKAPLLVVRNRNTIDQIELMGLNAVFKKRN
ncbi:MAG: c-type cytochrome [Bacteroidota bacterium]